MKCFIYILIRVCLAFICTSIVSIRVQASNSVSRLGFVWSFSADRPTGVFANGDPWVLGPVTITSITPNDPTPGDGEYINGSMLNPIPDSKQGYTTQIIQSGQVYNSTNNIALVIPITISNSVSIVSSQTPISYVAGGSISDKYAVLTIVMSEPASGSFRPPYCGSDKTIPGNISQIDYLKLPSLATVDGALDLSLVTSFYESIHYDHYSSWLNTHTAGKLQNPGYGRELANWYSHGLLHLCLNHTNSEKELLLIRLIQQGIDVWGFVSAGGNYYHDGGHQFGRKAVAVLAAHMLNSDSMLATVSQPGIFQEDEQTWVVNSSDVGRSVLSGYTYNQSMVATPEWGIRHYYEPTKDDSRWDATGTPYRFVCGNAMLAGALWANIMGIRDKWKWEPYFLYCDRFWSSENGNRGFWTPSLTSSGGNKIHTFVANMWESYRYYVAPPATNKVETPTFIPKPGSYSIPQIVTLSSGTGGSTIRYTDDGSNPSSSSGTIYSSPLTVSTTTTFKSIAYKIGMIDSPVVSAIYNIGNYVTMNSDNSFINIPLGKSFNQRFTAEWDAVPSSSNIDAVMSLSLGSINTISGCACITRFNTSGQIDARNAGAYVAVNTLAYVGGNKYHFRLVVNGFLPGTYDLFVTPDAGNEVKIASSYAFRIEQASVTSLDNIAISSPVGSISMSNVMSNSVKAPTPPTNLRELK